MGKQYDLCMRLCDMGKMLSEIQLESLKHVKEEQRALIRASRTSSKAVKVEDPAHAALSLLKTICDVFRNWTLSSSFTNEKDTVNLRRHSLLTHVGL